MIKIGSFNVRNLSDGKGRDLDRIAKFINYYQLDIVCLQEVLDEGKIIKGIDLSEPKGKAKAYDRSLKSRLSGQWDSQWEPGRNSHKKSLNYTQGDHRGEGYVIMWRTDRLRLPVENGKEVRPRPYTGYRRDYIDSTLGIAREPLYGRFILLNRNVEIRVITTHIIFGKPSIAEDVVDLKDIEIRKNEYKMIAGQIYYRINEMYKTQEFTSPYTVMLGDYNLEIGNKISSIPQVVLFDKKGRFVDENKQENAHFKVYNLQEEKTTLKSAEPQLANSYDHFTMDERLKNQIRKGSVSSVDLIHKYTEAQSEEEFFENYRKDVSDHLPIVISIDL